MLLGFCFVGEIKNASNTIIWVISAGFTICYKLCLSSAFYPFVKWAILLSVKDVRHHWYSTASSDHPALSGTQNPWGLKSVTMLYNKQWLCNIKPSAHMTALNILDIHVFPKAMQLFSWKGQKCSHVREGAKKHIIVTIHIFTIKGKVFFNKFLLMYLHHHLKTINTPDTSENMSGTYTELLLRR